MEYIITVKTNYLVTIAYRAWQDTDSSFVNEYICAYSQEEAEELVIGKLMRRLYKEGKYDAIVIEAVMSVQEHE